MSDTTDPEPVSSDSQSSDQVRRITVIVAGLAAVLFLYGLIADRSTPSTSQATAQAYLVQIAPEVMGKVIEVTAVDNERVEPGSVLFRIEPDSFELSVQRAEAALETVGQSVGASTAGLAAAEALLAQAVAKRANVRDQTGRTLELVAKGIYAAARKDAATANLASAEASVSQAEAEVEKARQALGPKGAANPQIKEAMASLRQAQLDLQRTTIYAPSDGGVTNLQLTVGQLLGKGQTAMTYIDAREIWIEAAFRENSLEHIKIGTPVKIILDIRPGRLYSGRIKSIGYGVSSHSIDPATGLPSIRNPSGWLRSPQPMPVRIEFDEPRPTELRIGSQATVMAFTGGNSVMNGIGWLRMWLNAVLTYVY